MNWSAVRKARVVVSLAFLIAVSVIFVDFTGLVPRAAFDALTYLQFVPSTMDFITAPALATAGVLFVLALTLLFGRVYCSSVCPLGALQDVVSRLGLRARKKRRPRHSYRKEDAALRYGILGATVAAFFGGSLILVNLLDPFSAFGRIAAWLFRPAAVWGNNLAYGALESFEIYAIYPHDVKGITIVALAVPLVTLGVVAWLSWSRGRRYCNVVCPVGALLGLAAKLSLFKIRIKDDACTLCGACETQCKGECIDSKNKRVDFDRCVMCFNCLDSCPTAGVELALGKRNRTEAEPAKFDFARRDFLVRSAAFAFGAAGFARAQETDVVPQKRNTVPVKRNVPVAPPGAGSVDHMTDRCTACHLCVSVCPPQVLQPSFLEYGALGLLQPHMDYKTAYCDFECVACTEICPSGALNPLPLEKKKLTQLGVVHFVQDNCVVFTEKTDCGACAEHCPTKAVYMVPHEGNLRKPELKEEVCVGCGACEYACPTYPWKAIYVEGNETHKLAEKPSEEEAERPDYDGEAFPF